MNPPCCQYYTNKCRVYKYSESDFIFVKTLFLLSFTIIFFIKLQTMRKSMNTDHQLWTLQNYIVSKWMKSTIGFEIQIFLFAILFSFYIIWTCQVKRPGLAWTIFQLRIITNKTTSNCILLLCLVVNESLIKFFLILCFIICRCSNGNLFYSDGSDTSNNTIKSGNLIPCEHNLSIYNRQDECYWNICL